MVILGICVMCKKKIKVDMVSAKKVDGLWLCGAGCIDKFLKEKKKWTPAGWDELCHLQVLYEERRWIGSKAS